MPNIHCEICGGSRLTKQHDFFVCCDCGTSYSLEDARKLLQNGSDHINQNVLKEVKGVVCPLCGAKLYEDGIFYICLASGCNYKYQLNKDNTVDGYDSSLYNGNDVIDYVGVGKTSVFSSKNIRISNKGIEYGDEFFPVEMVTGFQFKAVKSYANFHVGSLPRIKLFSIPTGTTFESTITFNGEYSFENTGNKKVLRFNRETYGEYIDALWKAFSGNVINNILIRLKNNEEVKIGQYASLYDTGLKVIKMNLLGANEEYFYDWNKARAHMSILHDDGKLKVEFDDVKSMGENLFFVLGFILNDNTNVLEVLLTYVKNNRINRLSDLL